MLLYSADCDVLARLDNLIASILMKCSLFGWEPQSFPAGSASISKRDDSLGQCAMSVSQSFFSGFTLLFRLSTSWLFTSHTVDKRLQPSDRILS